MACMSTTSNYLLLREEHLRKENGEEFVHEGVGDKPYVPRPTPGLAEKHAREAAARAGRASRPAFAAPIQIFDPVTAALGPFTRQSGWADRSLDMILALKRAGLL